MNLLRTRPQWHADQAAELGYRHRTTSKPGRMRPMTERLRLRKRQRRDEREWATKFAAALKEGQDDLHP